MAKVLYLTYDGLTDPLGQSQILPYLTRLAEKGHQFAIVSYEKKERFKYSGKEIKGLLTDAGIYWYPTTYKKWPPVLSTVYNVLQLRSKVNQLHHEFKPEIIHCRSYLTSLIGYEMKIKHHIPFIFDMRGFWADERVEGKLWDLTNPIYRWIYNYFKKKERSFLKSADCIICLTRRAKDILQSWEINTHTLPILIIPCCVDTELFDPDKISADDKVHLRERLNLAPDEFVLSYLGSIGTWYMLEEMLDFFRCLEHQIPRSRFLFISAEEPNYIKSKARERGIDPKLLIVNQVERREVPLYLSLSDLSIYFIRPTFSKSASSPTKQAEVLSMNIPLVCNPGIGDTEMIIEKSGAGWLFEVKPIESYVDLVKNIVYNLNEIKAGRKFVKSNLSLECGVSRYNKVYKKIMNFESIN